MNLWPVWKSSSYKSNSSQVIYLSLKFTITQLTLWMFSTLFDLKVSSDWRSVTEWFISLIISFFRWQQCKIIEMHDGQILPFDSVMLSFKIQFLHNKWYWKVNWILCSNVTMNVPFWNEWNSQQCNLAFDSVMSCIFFFQFGYKCMIQKWSPSNHQLTKWSTSSNQMVHRLSQSDHEMVTKWPNFKQFFDALQQILVANSYIYAYHCNVCRNWQLIQWGTILREWKRFDRVQDSINTWNERLLWAYYTFKCGLRLWHFDILFVYFFSCLFVHRIVLILQEKYGPIFLKNNYFLYIC